MTGYQIKGCALTLLISAAAWSLVASAIWCYLSHVCVAGQWWLLQWWFELPYWKSNWYVTLLVVGSAIGASLTVLVILAGARLALWPRDRRQPNLWGETGFANRNEMQRGGIRSTRTPFE